MSYITPQKYRELANKLGEAYAAVRDVINDSAISDSTEAYSDGTAYGIAKNVASDIVEASDDNDDGLTHDISVDPEGSIANDLGTSSFSFTSGLTESQSQTNRYDEPAL